MPRTTIRSEDVTDAQIKTADMAVDPTDASTLASGTIPTARLGSGTASATTFLRGDQSYAAVDTSGITANADDIALLGFRVAANGSFGKYNLVDQSVDAFEDATGVDASASTNEVRNSAGKFYSCTTDTTTSWSKTLTGTNNGWYSHTNRQVATGLTASGTQVRLTIESGDEGFICNNMSIVERDASTGDGTAVPTETLFSSSSGVTMGAQTTATSDWTTFTVTAGTEYLLIFDWRVFYSIFLL